MSPTLLFVAQVSGIIASILMLWRGADWFVDASARLARRYGMSELVIGLTLVGFGTSAPELAVSIGAALRGQADVSVGNVVGSNIFNLGFILGGCAALRPIVTSRALVMRDGLFLIGITVVLALFLTDLNLSRVEGLTLFAILFAYIALLFFKKQALEDLPAEADMPFRARRDIPLLVFGLAMIMGGAHVLVLSASGVARAFGLSEWAIGVTIVAAGTSAPELVTSLNAAAKGRFGMSAGNLVGSDIYNLLGVLGVAAMITPMQVDPSSISSVYLLVGMVCLVVFFMRTGWRLSRAEGLFLVAGNLVRWVFDISGKS